MNSRDDFTAKTKDILANRVGRRCSNPSCRKLTCGPSLWPHKLSNIGVAAHICAAAEGGPRYDPCMSPDERKSPDNGIWLCQNCAKMIDSDPVQYPVHILHEWKEIAEHYAECEMNFMRPADIEDMALIRFFVQCFDRPAFQDDVRVEGCIEDFDKAIEDTIVALNTGVLRTRDGQIIKEAEGKSAVSNPIWREKLDDIGDKLVSIRRRLDIAKKTDVLRVWDYGGSKIGYYFKDRELIEWFNNIREEIITEISSICREIGIRELHFSKRNYCRW